MKILIVGIEGNEKLIEKFCRERGIAVEKRIGPQGPTELVVGHMGIMRPAQSEVVVTRLRRELEELSTMQMIDIIGIVCGAQPQQVPTTRFSVAKMLTQHHPHAPVVVTERWSDLSEVTRYYGGADAVHVFSNETVLRPGKIHIIAPKAQDKTLEFFCEFLVQCHTHATSAS